MPFCVCLLLHYQCRAMHVYPGSHHALKQAPLEQLAMFTPIYRCQLGGSVATYSCYSLPQTTLPLANNPLMK